MRPIGELRTKQAIGSFAFVVLALGIAAAPAHAQSNGSRFLQRSVTPPPTGALPFQSNPAGPPPLGAVGPPPFNSTGSIPRNPAGPPPFGAVGPPPLGATGPPPLGAVGPPPLNATGPTPFDVTGPPPLGATGPPPLSATGPTPFDVTGPPPLGATGPTPEDPTGPPPFDATGAFAGFVNDHGVQQLVSASFFCEGHGRGFAGQQSFAGHLEQFHGMSLDESGEMLIDQGGVWTLPAY